jgi:hypothetical protein
MTFPGVYRAVVTAAMDPRQSGRVKVEIPAVLGQEQVGRGCSCRAAAPSRSPTRATRCWWPSKPAIQGVPSSSDRSGTNPIGLRNGAAPRNAPRNRGTQGSDRATRRLVILSRAPARAGLQPVTGPICPAAKRGIWSGTSRRRARRRCRLADRRRGPLARALPAGAAFTLCSLLLVGGASGELGTPTVIVDP